MVCRVLVLGFSGLWVNFGWDFVIVSGLCILINPYILVFISVFLVFL